MNVLRDNDRLKIFLFLFLFFVLSVILIFLTENSFGGGDHFSHFKIARWSWKYPYLLFDHWGKPVFTILISPFARLGMPFARMFNLIIGIATAYFAYKLVKLLDIKPAWFVILLVIFTPVYFSLMFAVLTEVLHSFFLVLAVYLFFSKKYYRSALLVSFLPLIRTESFLFIGVFVFALLLKKQYKSLIFLFSGFFLISILGFPFHESFFWLITDIPYTGSASDIYGSGSLFHFINETNKILGYPVAIPALIGLFVSLRKWILIERFKITGNFFFLLLVPANYLLFLAAHSYVWWQGIGNSLGLIRVIGAVAPLAAITAMFGFSYILDFIEKQTASRNLIILVTVGLIITVFSVCKNGFLISGEQKVIKKAMLYMKNRHLDNQKVVFFDPYVVYSLDKDPYNLNVAQEKLQYIGDSLALKKNVIIVWDAHYGPNEGRIKKERLLNDKSLKLLKTFKPDKPFKVIGGYDYEVCIFKKIN